MIFTCPNCSTKYRIPDERFTSDQMRVKCRSCGLISTLNRPQAEVLASPAARAASPVDEKGGRKRAPRLVEHWYYLKGKERKGPCTFADLDRLYAAGGFDLETWVWHPTLDGWKKARDVKILRPLLEKAEKAASPAEPPPLPVGVAGAGPGPAAPPRDVLRGLREVAAPAPEAQGVRQPIHRTENLINILEQMDKAEAEARAAAAPKAPAPEQAALFPGAERDEKDTRKIVELLEKLDHPDRLGEVLEDHERPFFEAPRRQALETRTAAAGEDLSVILKELAAEAAEEEKAVKAAADKEHRDAFSMSDIPDVVIPTEPHAPMPTRTERKQLVQEFSMMIRHERDTRRLKIISALVVLAVVGGAAFGLKYMAERPRAAQRVVESGSVATERPRYDAPATGRGAGLSHDQVNAAIEELRKKAAEEEEKRRAAQGALGGTGYTAPVKVTEPQEANAFEFKLGDSKPQGVQVAQGSLVTPAGQGGKEELAIGFKSSTEQKLAQSTFDEAEMTRTIQNKMKRFNACKQDMEPMRVQLEFTVGEAGTVTNLGLQSDRPMPAATAKCIREEIAKWVFPKPDKARSFTRILTLE
jgi:predicted Zn finger-like uncharacterized protein